MFSIPYWNLKYSDNICLGLKYADGFVLTAHKEGRKVSHFSTSSDCEIAIMTSLLNDKCLFLKLTHQIKKLRWFYTKNHQPQTNINNKTPSYANI